MARSSRNASGHGRWRLRKGVSILMTIRNIHIPIVRSKPIPARAIVEQAQKFYGVFAIAF